MTEGIRKVDVRTHSTALQLPDAPHTNRPLIKFALWIANLTGSHPRGLMSKAALLPYTVAKCGIQEEGLARMLHG